MKFLVLHGPNLNMLGLREPSIYGRRTLEDIDAAIQGLARVMGHEVRIEQHNGEGALVEAIQRAGFDPDQPWSCIADENGLNTTSVARLPTGASYGVLLIYGGNEDTGTLDPNLAKATAPALCAQGVPLRGVICGGQRQFVSGLLRALPAVADFVDARFAGEALTGECGLGEAVDCAAL